MKKIGQDYLSKAYKKTKEYFFLGSKAALKKTGKFIVPASIGAFKGTTKMVADGKALYKADEEINELTARLKAANNSFQSEYKGVKDKFPYIDAAVISGLTLFEMQMNGVPEKVLRAYEGAFGTETTFLEHWGSFDTQEGLQGFVNNIKGKLFEVEYVDYLNATLEPGLVASMAEQANQPGWDISITDTNGNVVEQLQNKATTSASYVKDALIENPHIDVVTLKDLEGDLLLAEYGDKVTASEFTDAYLTTEVLESAEGGINLVPPLLGLGFVVFSTYRRDDLTTFQKDMSIGERGSNLLINSGIIGLTGLAGIGIVFAKEYLLKKGGEKRALIKELRKAVAAQENSFFAWKEKMGELTSKTKEELKLSRRDFIKGLFAVGAHLTLKGAK